MARGMDIPQMDGLVTLPLQGKFRITVVIPAFAGMTIKKRVVQSIPGLLAYCCRASISCLISPIALAGFRPFGQVRVQFMIVWQR